MILPTSCGGGFWRCRSVVGNFKVTGSSYERLLTWCNANSTTPENASDAEIAVFADQYFEYDQARRVAKHTKQGEGGSACSGGLATNTLSYQTSAFADGYNNGRSKAVEMLADGNTNTIYTNFAGQPILTVFFARAMPRP